MSSRNATRVTIIVALLLSTIADAQLFRTYLAPRPLGDDANQCTLPAPCRLLPAALSAVVDGGEIWMLGSGNYNLSTVTIDKSVSILAVPGATGSVMAAGGPAIVISADNLKVALRNLVIVPLPNSGGTPSHGIFVIGASTLVIDDSLIANMPYDGVYVVGKGTVKITNSTIRNNGGSGVFVANGAQANIFRSRLLGNASANILVGGGFAGPTTATVSDSILSGGSFGVAAATAVAGENARVLVTRCTIDGTYAGLYSETDTDGSALISVSGSMITNNTFGWHQVGPGAAIKSLGNNHIQDNGGNTGNLTPASLQ